ncbi:GNAT family N-acetyltransferase [Alkalicoccobacillus murimartini]|uniref:GNAT superfamily N-acetyltransferase n=1 Tax=Alkalicoccobacillus murimartini TaxID=171685 RepID=A0ABT9YJM6_9BACI|nr:GNAT family N-acetyltransferase [Alkalicoccobacillus murimartini]MDQ0207941.1 GNAT superfamily N-acetyltransferase [Alkalicoccobacillus murimartini]
MVEIVKVDNSADKLLRSQIVDLLMEQMESIGPKDGRPELEGTIDRALEEESKAHLFIAIYQQQVIGAAFLNVGLSLGKGGQYIWLNDLFVSKNYRNRGIAKKLLLRIIYWAEQKQIKGIELETGRNNEATKALYNSLGFYDVISKRYGFRF